MTKGRKCVQFGSAKIPKILYGLPAFDEKLERDLEAGKVILGGCLISGNDPDWHCNDCDFEWSKVRGKPESNSTLETHGSNTKT